MTGLFDWERFQKLPLVGILRGFDLAASHAAVQSAALGGLTTVEITLNSPDAASQIERLRDEFGDRVNVGAGTVCTIEDAHLAIQCGATFIVTPIVDGDLIQVCRDADVPAFVGAMTPSEVFQAWKLGAAIVKVFPADVLGPAYLHSLRGPLPQISLMPTGGVTVESLASFHRAGAIAFGIGSPLFNAQRIAAQDWDWIQEQATRFVDAYRAVA
ncbi:bifunctional 4-hydroxy-2-oxoglutarate aldolase/2-dehydro-3-deoxy-phosphogluconate aldolase [Blastopirellula sp. J2-11]|uniref:bifunctional 4-hydroxy-2-oxoglutarate aldolase/2-dehydro-3-deoxy-phosphogluconate aldolase n=1 Tax=Blastopirellula sp. J2-11 TaxID=2943192 RepID=UPI0021C6160F|nr:bifunctional 4-hydroxy-2-oxoglutarate aldolase/2-dehydro-3-deoxy-phosphogluconate aldolase [Blastopirellula sp. J2-11]UUO04336.1 bifunctional 4-hydroxy-2-oxoglutarate aldolase/2-dehydro-3-deoxy-phosphogluconate aldolase [Blastopirellula sp. J2-11]